MIRKSFSAEVQISASIGVAMCPRDGSDDKTLYSKADSALYHVKRQGKDSYAFYRADMENDKQNDGAKPAARKTENATAVRRVKRRMLIVDDNLADVQLLTNMFRDSFLIEMAKDGETAMIRLRHFSTSISVVLLDLIMPGMDGFDVLEKMQQSPELQSIPVVVVSAAEDRETSLRAIRSGASDFVTKPIDPEILRLRVRSAIGKAENERLRAQNSMLAMQSDEMTRYKMALACTGTALIEHEWLSGTFIYDPLISRCLAGSYDERGLWRILLYDLVADTETVQKMQTLVHDVAKERATMDGSMTAELKTPGQVKHRFRMNVHKLVNEYRLTDRLIITFTDLDRT